MLVSERVIVVSPCSLEKKHGSSVEFKTSNSLSCWVWYDGMKIWWCLIYSSKLFVFMVWWSGTSVTFIGQKISLQMCTLDLRQTVSNTLNMGFTISLFALRKKGGNFHHQTAFSCCNCLQIRLKWTPHQRQMVIILGGWCADVSYVPLQAVHLPKSHVAGSGKCHHMEKKKTTQNEDGRQQNVLQVAKRQSGPHVPCHEHCYSRPAARGNTVLVKQPSCARSESEKVPPVVIRKKKGPDPWNGGHFFSRQPVPFWKHLRIFILLFCFMVYIWWSCI